MANNYHFSLVRIFTLFLWVSFYLLVMIPRPALAKSSNHVELVYVEWSSEVVSTNIIKVVLEMAGYDVEITPVTAAAMWQAVASNDADGLVAAWLTTTHAHYLTAVKDKVEDLGPNLVGTKIGLVVPAYVTIDSIEQLNGNIDKFEHRIIGIDPGAGLMSKTEQAMKDYKLDKFKLIEGSGATMAAVLGDAIKHQEWVVVTGWTPHWKFSRWKLKYLEDPKDVYGGEEHISTIVRKGLKEDMPEVYKILDNFHWNPADMEEIMVLNEKKGAEPYENAKEWVKAHPDRVKPWLDGIKIVKQP